MEAHARITFFLKKKERRADRANRRKQKYKFARIFTLLSLFYKRKINRQRKKKECNGRAQRKRTNQSSTNSFFLSYCGG